MDWLLNRPLLCFLVLSHCHLAENFDPLSMTIGGALVSGGLYMMKNGLLCQMYECCPSPHWVSHNVTKFDELFDAHVYGQHIAKEVLRKSLKIHLRRARRSKALVMSFHGPTGTGKNLVASLIAKSIYRQGMKSQYVHMFSSTVDFPNESKVDIYKLDVQKKVVELASNCKQSLFIFDEVDKMPLGLIDAIKPFIDFHEHVHGVDYREAIFIFLSNTGGTAINEIALEAWQNGRHRTDVQHSELERLVKSGAFNEIGGLQHSSLIEKSLVDIYVPFLPLERQHVKQCIQDYAKSLNLTQEITSDQVDSICDALDFLPNGYQVYSATGCKTIEARVDMLLEDL